MTDEPKKVSIMQPCGCCSEIEHLTYRIITIHPYTGAVEQEICQRCAENISASVGGEDAPEPGEHNMSQPWDQEAANQFIIKFEKL